MKTNRRRIIKELIDTTDFISLSQLISMFPDISSMTLRRDIEFFEESGDVIKVRGGARSLKYIRRSLEDPFYERMKENEDEKKRICARGLELIGSSRSVFFDSGTTMMKLASMMSDQRLTAATAAPNVAMELMHLKNAIVYIIGGIMNRNNISASGPKAIDFISGINIETALLVPSGYTPDEGFTCGNLDECELKRYIVKHAKRRILLMDSSKMGKNLPFTFATPNDIDVLVVGGGADFSSEYPSLNVINI